MTYGDITDVPGVLVGHAADRDAKTGVTVVLLPSPGVAGGAFMGGNACSTRQFDALRPLHIVDAIHAVCLCGGSAFGLDAGGGVVACLERKGIGFHVVGAVVPIVPTAAIFDLNFGDGSIRPTVEMGMRACGNACTGPIEQGSVGVGTGASVGKLFGIARGMKGGVGSASVKSGDLVIGALVAVNAYGDVIDLQGRIIAGARVSAESSVLADAGRLLEDGAARSAVRTVENTTLAVVATNAKMDKVVCSRVAAQATPGLGLVIRPFHSHIDGDLTVVLSCGDLDVDPNRVGLLAAKALQQAVINAVIHADGFGMIPCAQDLP